MEEIQEAMTNVRVKLAVFSPLDRNVRFSRMFSVLDDGSDT
jgi:hypothetical protein